MCGGDSCGGDSYTMNNYNYIATVHKPTAVTHSTVGHFTSSQHLNLIVAKHNRIEIYDFGCETRLRVCETRLQLLKEFPVNGGIITLKLLPLDDQTSDFLLLGTKGYNNLSFKFFVLSWDEDKKDLITRDALVIGDHIGEGEKICFFNHDYSRIGLRILSSREHGRPLTSVKFIHITHEGRIQEDFTIRFNILQQALFYHSEREILDIKFLHNAEIMLAVLFKVDPTVRTVETYTIALNEDYEPDNEYDSDKYALVKGPWSAPAISDAKLLIPVPSPCDGVLAVGDKSITFCSNAMPIVEHFVHYNHGDTVHGAISTDGLRFMFSSQNRNLQMLVLTQDDKMGTQLNLYVLGETSFASTISFLGHGIVYVGSVSGDSELIKMSLEPDASADQTKVEVLETFLNLGPVSDCCLAVLDQKEKLVTCSGQYNDGSLRILGKKNQSFSEAPGIGIEGMWCVEHSKNDEYERLLVVTLLEGTLILPVSREGELLEEEVFAGFCNSDRTLSCHNALETCVTQVTSNSVRLICLSSEELKCEWKPSLKRNILLASAIDTKVLLSTEEAHLYYLEICDNSTLQLKATVKLSNQISSLVLGVTGAATEYAAVGSWIQNSITIYSLPTLTVRTVELLEAQPRSLLICPLDGIPYLFCVTAEGSVVYFMLDLTTGELTSRRSLSFGMRPVTLQLIEHHNARQVFVASDQPAIIYGSAKNLHIISVNRAGISQICSVSTSILPNSVAIATADSLTLEALEDWRIDVHSHYLLEQPLCIAYQRQSQTFTVACVKSSKLSETSCIHLLDERMFGILDTYVLGSSGLDMVYAVSVISCEFSGDALEYVCVGTAGGVQRIKVFVIRERKLQMVTETGYSRGGPVLCMAASNGMLIARVGVNYLIYKWDKDARNLVQVSQHRAVGQEYATCLRCNGNFIFGGKLAEVMQFEEGRGIVSLAYNVSHRLTAVEILQAGVFVGATEKQTLVFFRRNEFAADEESGLEAVAEYYIGDQVTRFCAGSAGEITTTLFSTINGAIGLLASLPEQRYEVLERLQGVLREDFINQAADEGGWRLYYHEIHPADSHLLDGDLVKSFSGMEISRKNQIAQNLHTSVEEIVEEVLDLF